MTDIRTDVRLEGLEPDNLLAFMALLGLLRALDTARPVWFARACFTSVPLRPNLVVDVAATENEIANAADEGCRALARAFVFGQPDLNFSSEEARSMLAGAVESDLTRASVLSALCSDLAAREDGARILPTPLCAMFGQGHQHFLQRLTSVSSGTPPRALAKRVSADELNHPDRIADALFRPWQRRDATEAFRWDFEEDRRYALRFENPSNDPATTEHGANRLAVLGLLSFQCSPAAHGKWVALATRGVWREKGSGARITWPLWSVPATLDAIHAMMDRTDLLLPSPNFRKLRNLGIFQARRVRRFSADKFICFSRAEALLPRASAADG